MKNVSCTFFSALVSMSLTATATPAGIITADEEGALTLDNWELNNSESDGKTELFEHDLLDTLLDSLAAERNAVPTPEVRWAIRALDRTGSEADFDLLQRVLNDERRNVGGWAFLAIWSVDNGRLEVARAAVAKARELDEGNPSTMVAMAALQNEEGDVDGAVSILRQVITKFPGNFSAADRLSNLYAAKGDLAAAVAPLDAWLSRNGVSQSSASVAFRVSQLLMDLKGFDRALEILSDYIRLPALPEQERTGGILLAAQVALASGDLPKARDFLSLRQDWPGQVNLAAVLSAAVEAQERTTEQSERQLDALKDDAEVGVLATRYLAALKFRNEAFSEGRALFETAISRTQGARQVQILEDYIGHLDTADLSPEANAFLEANAQNLGVVAHVMLADRQLQQEQYTAAAQTSSVGLAAFPRNPELYFIRGMASFLDGDLEAAKMDFGAATKLNPDHARAWVSLAKLEHEAGGHGGPGRHVNTINIYKRALEVSPDNAIIEIELGKIAQEEDRLDDAEQWFRKSLVSAPSDPLAQSLLAILLADTERLPEALSLASRAMTALPDHHQVLFAKGRVEFAAGNYTSAADALIGANRIRPEHGHSLAYAATALARQDRLPEAAEVAASALLLALRDNEMQIAREVLSEHHPRRTLHADINRIDTDGVHEKHGSIALSDTPMGLHVKVDLAGARVGPNSVHLHENPSCAPGMRDGSPVAGLSAGAHYGSEWVSGDAHAHHAMASQTGASTDAEPMMQDMGPMTMTMGHGDHSMEMVMRSPDMPVGDLPSLVAGDSGDASYSVFVPYLHTSMLINRSVVMHDGTDAVRAFCGVLSQNPPAE